MENVNEKQLWVVYVEDKEYEGSTSIEGVVSDLDVFKKLAKEKYGIMNEPIENEYGRGSLHYEYSVKKSEKYSEYYHLVAEPKKQIG
jgi:hypothetical protein